MIHIKKSASPAILREQGDNWQRAWMQELASNSPTLGPLKHYKHAEVIEALWHEARNKCAYCESPLSLKTCDVEHFLPKPQYPQHVFRWENLLGVCVTCNAHKANFDCGAKPIVNPTKDCPLNYFSFEFEYMSISPSAPDRMVAQRTIEVLALNRPKLLEQRATALSQSTIPWSLELPFSACLKSHQSKP